MRPAAAAPLVLLAVVALAQQPSPPVRARFVDQRTGVPIICEIDPDMFPREWSSAEINALASPLSPALIEKSLTATRAAMAKYPAKMLKDNLLKIYISRKISFYGIEYGGTNSLDRVYLTNDGPLRGYTSEIVEKMFHHEFSSILLRNRPTSVPKRDWLAANAPGFRYSGDGVQAVRSGTASMEYEPTLHRQGFLCQYATSSFEEDFNTIAEGLFAGGKPFWNAVDLHERLRRKVRLAIGFYRSIDASFTEARFRSFSR